MFGRSRPAVVSAPSPCIASMRCTAGHRSTITVEPAPARSSICRRRCATVCSAASNPGETNPFPQDYNQAIKQAQDATLAALADGAELIEVEFPTASLSSVSGDAEGANEMNFSLRFLRQFLRGSLEQRAATTRVFFPDDKELKLAREGAGKDPNSGAWDLEPVFAQTAFKLGYLTKPNGLFDLGLDLAGFQAASLVAPSDDLFIAAYPHFDPREVVALERLWQAAGRDPVRPIITFNAELDRIRTGYYPPFFYPAVGRLAKSFIPKFTRAYYIHNFKGSGGGALFRSYPGPWQVFSRIGDGMKLVHTQEEAPTLREVALNILPVAARTRSA